MSRHFPLDHRTSHDFSPLHHRHLMATTPSHPFRALSTEENRNIFLTTISSPPSPKTPGGWVQTQTAFPLQSVSSSSQCGREAWTDICHSLTMVPGAAEGQRQEGELHSVYMLLVWSLAVLTASSGYHLQGQRSWWIPVSQHITLPWDFRRRPESSSQLPPPPAIWAEVRCVL